MRSTRANIHTQNLTNNYKQIKKRCGNAQICAVVKADGYGHGAIEVSKVLQKVGCNFFGVATIYEAQDLIDSGITKQILLFSLPTYEEITHIVSLNIEPIVTTLEFIELLEKECQRQNKKINIHLKIDTGMGRIGCRPEDGLKLGKRISESKNLILKGLCTHLSTSESEDQDYSNIQLEKFIKVKELLEENNIYPKYIHAANSGAMIKNRDSIFNLVRTGINLYGYPPTKNIEEHLGFKPVMELKTKVVELKEVPKGTSISYSRTYVTEEISLIATLPIGYADGYLRAFSNIGEVSINGNLYPIIGNICMDQMMVKVDKRVNLFDDVVLIGTSKDEPNAETLAKKIGTISYEILTNIHRVKKFYIK